jgi:hypothetical protein
MNACRKPEATLFPYPFTRLLLPLLLGLTLSAAACRSTHFPDHPQEHRLARELAAAPDPYYKFLANGVFSRLAGLPPEATTKGLLRQLKEQHWKHLEHLTTSQAVVAELRRRGLPQVADTIQTALQALAAQRPAAPDPKLEAAAVKQGLIEAYYGFFPPPAR